PEGGRVGRVEQPGGNLARLPRPAADRLRTGAGVGAQAAGRWPRRAPGGRGDPGDLPVGGERPRCGTVIVPCPLPLVPCGGCQGQGTRDQGRGTKECLSRARTPPITPSICCCGWPSACCKPCRRARRAGWPAGWPGCCTTRTGATAWSPTTTCATPFPG